MSKSKQELYERVYASIGGDNVTEDYEMLLEMLLSFSKDDELDYGLIKDHLLYHIGMNEIDLSFAYKFNSKLRLYLQDEIKETVKQKGNPITVAAYIGLNQPEDEEIITLVVNAIKNTYPEHDDELNALEALKLYLEEKNLSDDVVTAIKKTRDPEIIVCAALCFEKELIKDVFGSKKDMYFYLLANTFTDNENIEFYKERLLQMDNHAFTKSINNSAKRIDQKIKEKKLI